MLLAGQLQRPEAIREAFIGIFVEVTLISIGDKS